ncbi:acetyltransferase, GNAT family [Actinomyces johnsonii F0510]|uniref:Acetyltransferase, GNAT family n=1 Tax=Actinomyces johnsonii F0510 TaxID=1227262 RepID=U1Q5Y2_9ACTO|nr:GNAT family N-acetyltransferase [Actinomyces johnsonii]ERH23295.1 acetyltransferase, GNAT family [Actinomyces johnsonii F0510]
MGVTTSSPHLRCASPDDLDAGRDLLTDVFLVDPLMSTIIGAAPEPRAALEHLHHVELSATYLNPDHPASLGDLAVDDAMCEAEPHWYLYMIAVAPDARGTGTGAALLRRGLERVDAQGMVAHLEATTRRAASFYGRHGFVDSAILNSEGRLPDYWAMTRPKRRQH